MMAQFRVFLVGVGEPLQVNLPVASIGELAEIASRARFLEAHMAEADSDGVYSAVLIPTCRIHFIVETS